MTTVNEEKTIPLAAPDKEPTKEKLEAAALSLAMFWPTRTPRQCTIALLNSEEGPKVRAAAREMLIAAERYND